MKSIETIREEINEIDQKIAELYEKRMELMNDVAEYKIRNDLPVLDLEREQQVIQKNSSYIQDPKYKDLYCDFIQFIMDQGKSIQDKLVDRQKNE